MSSIRNVKLAGVLAASALALMLGAEPAHADGPRARPAQAGGAMRGRPEQRPVRRPEQRPERRVTRETETTRTEDGFTRNTTITNAEGRTATRAMTVVHDKDAGRHVVDIERTGFDGRTSTVHHERQRTEDGFTRDSTRTLPDGQTRTRAVEVACDRAAGKCTRTVEVNGGAEND